MIKQLLIIIILVVLICVSGMLFLREGNKFLREKSFEKLYTLWEYEQILEKYSIHRNGSSEHLHNLGNTTYRNYQKNKTELWLQKSLEYYEKSLGIEEDENTRYNYEFVKKLLQEQQENSQGESEEDSEESDWGEGSKEQSENEREGEGQTVSEEGSENQQTVNNARDEQYKLSEDQAIDTLSPNEKEYLNYATQRLKEEQRYNQRFYNKQEEPGKFNQLFDSFFGNQIDRGGEKDW